MPGDILVEDVGRQRKRNTHAARPQHGDRRHERAPPRGLKSTDFALERQRIVQVATHRREQRVTRRDAHASQLAAMVVVRLPDAAQRSEPLPEKLEPASGRSGFQRWGAHSTCDSSSTVLRGSSGSVLRLRSMRVPGPG